MELLLPYLVLLGIVFLFFVVCYFVFKPKAKKVTRRDEYKAQEYSSYDYKGYDYKAYDNEKYRMPKSEKKVDYGALYAEEAKQAREQSPKATMASTLSNEELSKTGSVDPQIEADLTQLIFPVQEAQAAHKEWVTEVTEGDDKTRLMPTIRKEVDERTRLIKTVKEEKINDALTIMEHPYANKEFVLGVRPFVVLHSHLTEEIIDGVNAMTAEAYRRLQLTSEEEITHLLENIVVQEALTCMQKAYSSNPTMWMRETALEAFIDVVEQPKSSTMYLVAFDSLHILPHLTLGHFQAMAIVLLIKYSRNSNNYSYKNFRHYIEKYVEPFLSDLMTDESPYRQLDYLACTVSEGEKESFTSVLSQTYPFVFNYEGFTLEELESVLQGPVDEKLVEESMNSNLYKLPIVDETMAQRFFRSTNVNDVFVQKQLLGLMKSRPVAFQGHEALDVLQAISPVLVGLNRTYDATPLCTLSLTLRGLYLARAHVKVMIGESFDLSRWF